MTSHTTKERAIANCASWLARAREEREQRAADGGPEAVAEAAWVPGGPSREEIAAMYRRWQAEAADSA